MQPDGWETKNIGEFMDFKNGVNADKDAYGEGVKFVNVMDVFDHDFLLQTNVRGSMTANEKQQKEYSVCHGDILFNRTSETENDIGMTAVYMDDQPIIFGGFVIRGRQKNPVLLPEYAGYCFRSSAARREIVRRGQGAIRTNIGQKDLSLVPILVPPKLEQQAISDVLLMWDKTLKSTNKLIKEKQMQKKALMQRLLTGKHRFPEFEGEEWTTLKADQIFKSFTKKRNENEPLLAVMQDIGVVPRDSLDRRVAMPDGSTDSYKLIVPGDFVISLRSFQGGLEYSRYRGIVSPAYTILKSIRPINDDFYRHYFKSYDFIGHLAVAVIGIRDGKQISYDDFSFMNIPCPSVKEQQKIAAVLNEADKEIDLLTQKLEGYEEQKKGLMQQLLTGKKRVKLDRQEAA
ncbi:MAG: hypothetical protein CBB87_06040 [Micavibrio sp. TMED27]|nr:hypothetical protein [Micavibrio sp.]OUT91573.1 MAG: hypothetical protein CBB87_06040 [Micavibrio sp. TMED27]|tara:strand:+ start:1007 stop:2212 length:1206 start_codon:yes stop_codon:yes gene_type:complete